MIATGADPLAPGRLLAERYRIGPLLGSGGTAAVHRATDELLGRTVAVKALVRAVGDDAAERRERAEIELLASVHHRSLVTLFDAGKAHVDGLPVSFLVMELVEGPSLAQRLEEGPLPLAAVERLARDLAEALAVVHAHGIVHRDVKPANVLLAPAPLHRSAFDAKLADFGIAALIGADRLTATGTVLGTAAYLSPEQATGARVEASSDIYSLGLVLLEALTGRREYPGSLVESLSARLARDPEIPGELGYPWKSLLTAMTTRDPAERPTATAVLERLSRPAGGADATAATTAAAAAAAATAATSIGATAALAAPLEATRPLAVDDSATTARTAASRPQRSRRTRGLAVALGLAAAGALVAIPVLSQQPAPSGKAPVEIELADLPGLVPDQGVAEPAITEPEPEQVAEPAPAPAPVAEPEPAVVVTPADGSNGNNGDGNANGNNGNGNGNAGDNGDDNGSGSGSGNAGNGNAGNGNGNAGDGGNGNRGNNGNVNGNGNRP
ncbi:serine/threonine-protein kinase [Agrococcus sp. TSP3-2-1]|uniref:serine/threonine-protein kinase n=1 Tax=Agrococcus sp. TSP3-2-1 TaxID=2804583 RepID=UPI003CF30F6E